MCQNRIHWKPTPPDEEMAVEMVDEPIAWGRT